MKPSHLLTTLPIIAAAAFPASFAAEAFGCSVPTILDASHMFGVFVIALTIQTLFADYRRIPTHAIAVGSEVTSGRRSMFPLAA